MDFTPSVYEHCAALIRRRPWDVSRDAALLFEGQAAAFRRYAHSPVVVGVDIYNLEAEAYGAEVEEPDGMGTPAIVRHPLSSIEAVRSIEPFDPATDGRIPMVMEVARRLQDTFPEADVRVPVSGPFSIASNLVGFDLLLRACLQRPAAAGQALGALVEGQVRFCRAVVERGLDIAFFESAAAPPLLSPALFARVELPALRTMISRAAGVVGHPVPCVMGGDTAPILAHLMETGTGYVICPASNETDQEAFMHFMEEYPEVLVRINLRPDITASGDWGTIRREVDRILVLAGERPRVCLGTGALPYETSPTTVERIREYVASADRPQRSDVERCSMTTT